MPSPTTSQLDNFTRADENPIAGNWTSPILSDYRDATELWTNTMGANPGDAYWNVAEFTDCEVWGTIYTQADSLDLSTALWARIQGEGGPYASSSFYYVQYRADGDLSTWIYTIGKVVVGTATGLVQDASLGLVPAGGDSFWFEVIGDTLSFYWKVGAGAWTLIDSVVDPQNSIPGAGYIGAGWDDSSTRWSAFGGGTYSGLTLDTVLPDADITTTGWSTPPLFSQVNDDSDATVITATAS